MKLINTFPAWMTGGGIFSILDGVPWDNDAGTSKLALDIEYFGNRSGFRETSSLIDKMIAPEMDYNVNHSLSDVEKQRLCSLIKTLFLKNWTRLWDLNNSVYEPLENYNMIENGLDTHSNTGSSESNSSKSTETSMNQSTDLTQTVSQKTDMTTDVQNAIYGLGAVSAADESHNISHMTGDDDDNITTTHSQGSAAGNTTTGEGSETAEDTTTTSEQGSLDHTLTRRGNIGVTTSQQMAQSEIELWKWHFFQTVFENVDSVLTAPYWRIGR